MKQLFYRIPYTIRDIYKGRNLLWQLLAFSITYFIVIFGFDWTYFKATTGISRFIIIPAVTLGGLLPIVVPLTLVTWGHLKKRTGFITVGWCVGQAALLGSFISSLYKAFTGRIPPPDVWNHASDTIQTLTDTSHGFQFGFWEGGIFWGWPSSHTTIAFAMGVALFTLLPHRHYIRYLALAWAVYVGLSISVSIHWFSEFVAGAIIGSVIGYVVGMSFRKETK